MKPEVMLELLEGVAEQLGVKVTYEPLQMAGVTSSMRGGLCKVKGQYRVIVDKRATDEERVATLAGSLGRFDTSAMKLPAPVRQALALHHGSGPRIAA
ncbi:MAG TPA: hypothetical protein VGC41_24355 [Kofleriaceae bacterium]